MLFLSFGKSNQMGTKENAQHRSKVEQDGITDGQYSITLIAFHVFVQILWGKSVPGFVTAYFLIIRMI